MTAAEGAEPGSLTGSGESPLLGRLVFVVGAPRSGTNWIQRIIASHPQAVALPTETYLFSHGVAAMRERIQHAAPGSYGLGAVYMDRTHWVTAMRRFCDEVFLGLLETLDPSARYLVERTPLHTTHLELIASLYPDAKVVSIVRDGRDVVRSQLSTGWGPDSFTRAVTEWADYVRAAHAGGPLFNTFVEIRYEQLLENPRETVRAIYGALDLDANDVDLARAVQEAQVPFNVDPAMPGIRIGKWRSSFSPEEVRQFEAIGGDALDLLGYERAVGRSLAEPAAVEAPQPPTRRTNASAAARRTLGRARACAARRISRGVSASDVPSTHAQLVASQEACDRWLEAVESGRLAEVGPLLHPLVLVMVVGGGEPWSDRGPAAVSRLADYLAADETAGCRQRRGDVHPGLPTFGVVKTFELPDGSSVDRSWFITIERAKITRLTYYAFPLERKRT